MTLTEDPAAKQRAPAEEFQMNEFICYFNQGGLVEHAAVKRAMELFATAVMLRCR